MKTITGKTVTKEEVGTLIKVEMSKAIEALKLLPATGEKDNNTGAVGGMSDAPSADAAKTWLREALQKADIDGVTEVYDKCQKRAFNGMLFVKFSSPEKRDGAIEKYNAAKNKFAEEPSFMNRERPLQQRIKFSFLLNLKRLLTDWGYLSVRFDEVSGVLSVAGAGDVLQATIDGPEFKLKWLSDAWGKWGELTNDPKFEELNHTAKEKLAQSLDKGKGKGKASAPE
jgi:hypothetical protein